jgi:hypothetical protein
LQPRLDSRLLDRSGTAVAGRALQDVVTAAAGAAVVGTVLTGFTAAAVIVSTVVITVLAATVVIATAIVAVLAAAMVVATMLAAAMLAAAVIVIGESRLQGDAGTLPVDLDCVGRRREGECEQACTGQKLHGC